MVDIQDYEPGKLDVAHRSTKNKVYKQKKKLIALNVS